MDGGNFRFIVLLKHKVMVSQVHRNRMCVEDLFSQIQSHIQNVHIHTFDFIATVLWCKLLL